MLITIVINADPGESDTRTTAPENVEGLSLVVGSDPRIAESADRRRLRVRQLVRV